MGGDQRGLANKLLHVRRGSTERYQGQRPRIPSLSMEYGSTTVRVCEAYREAPSRKIWSQV